MVYKKVKYLLKGILYKLYLPRGAYCYYNKAKEELKSKNIKSAIKALEEGIEVYPDNYTLNAEVINIAMTAKKWSVAVQHWETVFKLKRKPKVVAYLGYAKSLQQSKHVKKAINLLTKGLTQYPMNLKLMQKKANLLYSQKSWKEAALLWDILFKENKRFSEETYLNAADSFKKLGDLSKAELVLKKGVKEVYSNQILHEYVNISIDQMDWSEALKRLDIAINAYENKVPMNFYLYKAMIYQIVGEKEQANNLYEYVFGKYDKEIRNEKKSYKKLTFFNNGESRIDFYKKLESTQTVIVTFDSLNMTWDNPSFGFKLLIRQNVDIVAVRKRKPSTHHQDLSLNDFYNAVNPLVEDYNHKVAYGYSLGGYTSLYYGGSIDCRILSLAPRLSIHPKYGKLGEKSKDKFKHSLSLPHNPNIQPIIVFDPKQKLDNRFVIEEALNAYPESSLVKLPYGGHGIAPHLLRMGELKRYILSVINENKVPKYNRKLKSRSNIYLRVLGRACLSREKVKWARTLAEESLRLLPTDKYGISLKVDVLTKMGCYKEAIEFVKSTIKLVPKSLETRELLIELYIEKGDMLIAEAEIKKAEEMFGHSEKLSILKRDLEKLLPS